jgi:hypothetical protein
MWGKPDPRLFDHRPPSASVTSSIAGEGLMRRFLGMTVLLTTLIAQGCTKKPDGIPLSSFRIDYEAWDCKQLREEADLLDDALAVASGNGRADETVAHIKAATEAVHRASTLKRCRA